LVSQTVPIHQSFNHEISVNDDNDIWGFLLMLNAHDYATLLLLFASLNYCCQLPLVLKLLFPFINLSPKKEKKIHPNHVIYEVGT